MDFTIREGQAGDCTDVSRMIMELAVYEKLPEQVKISHKELEQDGFSDHPFFKLLIAEVSDENKSKDGHTKVGYALYFYSYSSWKGKALYMEDLYVMPEFRGKGIGKALLKRVAQVGQEAGCAQLDFTVLDWNKASRDFYHSQGCWDLTTRMGYHCMRCNGAELRCLAGGEGEN
ncbi:thialysine N-epsilon-acetyltransferase isoform X1 [Amia ocellicauda]|uniref:thialysine N-epsilon-acetyltransferase isoform X1 n=1 Tax=Amia ocellicauda TaxID=2972642 RepID=UPI003463FDF4